MSILIAKKYILCSRGRPPTQTERVTAPAPDSDKKSSFNIKVPSLRRAFLFAGLVLFFYSPLCVFAKPLPKSACVFQGRAHPETKQEETARLYSLICQWFLTHFNVTFDPEIILNNVYYIDSWDEVEFVTIPGNSVQHGLFHHITNKYINDIYFLEGETPVYDTQDDIINQSIIVHEMVHFFTKKAAFDSIIANKVYKNHPIIEAFTYWAQDQFVQYATQGRHRLVDYMSEVTGNATAVTFTPFPDVSYLLYRSNYKGFVYNAVLWIGRNPAEKYQAIMNGDFSDNRY